MPRPGPRRIYFGARLFTPDEHETVQQLAAVETDGNLSEVVRKLVLEALAQRGYPADQVLNLQRKPRGRTPTTTPKETT